MPYKKEKAQLVAVAAPPFSDRCSMGSTKLTPPGEETLEACPEAWLGKSHHSQNSKLHFWSLEKEYYCIEIFVSYNIQIWLGIVADAYNPNNSGAEARGSQFQGQPGNLVQPLIEIKNKKELRI